MTYVYAIGLGSNRPHGRHGTPREVIAAALEFVTPIRASSIIETPPLGPSARRFANAAAIIQSPLAPVDLLAWLKKIERDFGRRPGRRWGARVLDLDILLWSEGRWSTRMLRIPHPQLRDRAFVLLPLREIAWQWRIPGGGTPRQLVARLTRPRPIHRSSPRSGP